MNKYIKKIFKNKKILSTIVSVFILVLIISLSQTWPFILLNKKIQNNYYPFKNLIFWNKISDKILIVEIDDQTFKIDKKEKLWLGRFPFDRKNYIPVIQNLKDAWAKVIGFDIIFSEKTSSDKNLSKTIKKAWNVIIWWFFSKEKEANKEKIVFNKSVFSDSTIATWYYTPKINKYNNVVYWVIPFVKFKNGSFYDHFSFSVLKTYYSYIHNKTYLKEEPKKKNNNYYLNSSKNIPFATKQTNEVLINYFKRTDYKKNNKIISFIDIYDEKRFKKLKEFVSFKDKIVLIWISASGIKDIFYTPNGIEYGIYTHVNMINTVLTWAFLNYFDKNLELLFIFILIVCAVYFNISRLWYVLIFSNIAIITIFLLIFPALILTLTISIPNYFIELLVALFLSLILSNIIKYLMENKDRLKLGKALSEYVSENVAHEILSWAWKINLNGEKKDIAIFFSDIEWFTSISEKFTPEILVLFLREYLTNMSDIIMDEWWFINKYEWDAIMALWWVFGINTSTTYSACLSAIKQQKLLEILNKDWKKRWFSEIKVRIWIHFWEAIIWNIWSSWRKMEFTALWDSVNLASRMEWVNKFYGTYICVSEDVYKKVKNDFEFRYLDKIRVKWKKIWVNIYELVEEKWKIQEKQKNIFIKFDEAISLYLSRDFVKALSVFDDLVKLWDKPSQTYKSRCEMYIKNPPEDDWDQIWTMESK